MRIIENKILVDEFLKFQKLIFLWFIILRQNTKIKKLIDNF